MGNAHIKPHPRVRNKKQVHWKAADRPTCPGKPELLPENEGSPDLITLQWLRPLHDGGSPIAGYLVEHRRMGSPHWVRATPLLVPFPEITLSGLEPGWRYQFRVSAENAVGYSTPSEISDPITVTLQRSAITSPKFTQDVADTVALENEKCEFVAYFLGQPAPRICWFKDDFEIFSSRRIRILTEHDRSVLTIHQTSLSDEGEIKCTATNRAGHVTTKAKLTVEAPPSVRLPRNYEEGLLFEIGELIRLKVSVVGRPTPIVFWSHNGESLQNNERHEVEYADKTCTLKITDAQRSDRGEYQIKAANQLGSDSASFLVTITDKPTPPGKAQVVMTLGRSVTLSWASPKDDGGSKIGNYIIEYYRLGWNVWLKAATTRQLSTRLGDLIEGSEYKFRIKAESPYGISEPSDESEVIFIPDPKRGLTHPPTRGHSAEVTPTRVGRKNHPRSLSSSRVEASKVIEQEMPPLRPKRTKSKSQQQTPEASPMLPRKDVMSQINKTIFDRSSLARDLAYGSPELKLLQQNSFEDQEEAIEDSTIYTVKIEPPKETQTAVIIEKPQSPKAKNKFIRELSGAVSGSSEFMLVLYSDDPTENPVFNFEENTIAPPLSLSAPELSNLEPPEFPGLKYSASSTELLHERTMMRLNEAAEEEERDLERRKQAQNSERRPSHEIPKIRINSEDSDDIVGLDRRHSLRKKLSGAGQYRSKWNQKRHSLKNPSELSNEGMSLRRAPISLNMKRSIMMSEQTTSEELSDQDFDTRRGYTQSSFERSPVSIKEERSWNVEYEESLSESESETDSDMERFKMEVCKTRKVQIDTEEDTYRPPGGLSGMVSLNKEPFEILNKRKELPNPNFVPKPILKKTDSPLVSPPVSPPSSPIKSARALSPRPDIILDRNRTKSLAVPELPPLLSSSGDESDETNKPRTRSLSLSLTQAKKDSSKPKTQSTTTLPSVTTVAEISGITAASIVIPNKLLNKKKNEEEARVMADHYDHILKSVGQRRRSNPILDRDELMKAARKLETPQDEDLSSKEQTPSKENLSQDSGYQSVSGYRRSSFTDHYDSFPIFRSPVRTAEAPKPVIKERSPEPKPKNMRRSSDFGSQTKVSLRRDSGAGLSQLRRDSGAGSSQLRRDSGAGVQLGNFANTPKSVNSGSNSIHSSRRSSLTTPSGKRAVSRSKSPSKRGTSIARKAATISPARPENWNDDRRVSPYNRKSSPSPRTTRRMMLKEITTQTSGFLDSFDGPSLDKRKQEELAVRAEVQVRTAVDWLLDLAMFAVACWLYLFQNELLAIPVLVVMVYRQLKEEIKKRTPSWVVKKFRKKSSTNN
ncbi:uncharacterized protein MnM [Euwallacea similis]|uniref:uncharacterized protein MnM n=1 Tax=Euwallacea similis TaxID=1736056 RepID=UPI00344FFD0A